MKAVWTVGLACLAQASKLNRDVSCEVCQTLVYDSHKRVKEGPKTRQKGLQLPILIGEVLDEPCSTPKWTEYAAKAELEAFVMAKECSKVFPVIEEGLETGLEGHNHAGNEATLRAKLCLKKPATPGKKPKKALQQGYCEALWEPSDLPSMRESPGNRNVREGAEFLAQKKGEPDVVATQSGIMYKVFTRGNGTIKPTPQDEVSCHYSGTLTDGTEFDSSYARGQPATFGLSGVIRGWTEVLQLMVKGDMWEVYIPGHLAYGSNGSPPKIGPNAVLVFKIELLGVVGKDAGTSMDNSATERTTTETERLEL